MIEDFRDLLVSLNEHAVRYLVVGAHALAAHGVPRVTGDLDVWIAPDEGNANRAWSALAAFGAPLVSLAITPQDFSVADRVTQIGLPPYRIDVLTTISGVSFEEAWPGRFVGTMFDVPVAFLGRDSLIRNKRASGRAKDLADVRALGN